MGNWRALAAHGAAKPALAGVCLLPFVWLFWGAATGGLGPNPAEALIRSTGDWTLRALCVVLMVTPLRALLQWPQLLRLRRMLGLFVFFYAMLHLVAYAWLDMGLDVGDIARDIGKRLFILVGFVAWVGLLLLAATSFNSAVRWMGAARWRALHRLVYGIAILAVLHFFWMRAGKNDFAEVAVYAVILSALLGWRVWAAMRPAATSR